MGWQELKGVEAFSAGEDVGNGSPYVQTWTATLLGKNNLVISSKIKNTHTVWPSNSTSGNLSYREKKGPVCKDIGTKTFIAALSVVG